MSTPHTLIKDGQPIQYNPPFSAFPQFLENLAENDPTKQAIVFVPIKGTNITLTREDLADSVATLAATMQKSWNLDVSDAISFCLPNTPEVLLINYAAWSLGLLSVPLDSTRDTTERKIYKLQQTNAQVLVTRDDKKSLFENAEIQNALPHLKILTFKNFTDFKKQLLSKKLTPDYPETDFSEPALILYTSGTTALPKGVELTVTSLFANAACIRDWLQFTPEDRWQVLLPLHHINSTTFANTTLLVGGTIILVEHYSKSRFWQYLAETNSTGASIVPTIAYDLLTEQQTFEKHQAKLKQVARFQLGSAPVQPRVVEQFMKQFNIPLYQGYGQTETSLRSTGVPMDLTKKEYEHIRELNSLGTEMSLANVTVLDEKGSELEAEAVGEICVRGPIIMRGYLKNIDATEESFAHDWFHSGDTGYYRELYDRKFFFLKGRSKEIIKKGGVLLSPLAIENALLAHYPDLDQVYVIGFDDARLGERIGFVAVTKVHDLVPQILEDAKKGAIPTLKPYELPDSGLRITPEVLPKTATGKVQRLEIKKQFGPLLLEAFRTIALADDGTRFRLIGPEEEKVLSKAAEIDENRWGSHLAGSSASFMQRAQNGALIGAFDDRNSLLGTISAVRLDETELLDSIQPDHWASTWDGITGNGTLNTNSHKGDTLVLVAVAVASGKATSPSPTPPKPISEKLHQESLKHLQKYAKSGEDPVLAFHGMKKAGMPSGATVVHSLPNSRPADWMALGHNVLVQYPEISSEPVISVPASTGTQLVEAAILYAFQNGITNVYAYSRPAKYHDYLTK